MIKKNSWPDCSLRSGYLPRAQFWNLSFWKNLNFHDFFTLVYGKRHKINARHKRDVKNSWICGLCDEKKRNNWSAARFFYSFMHPFYVFPVLHPLLPTKVLTRFLFAWTPNEHWKRLMFALPPVLHGGEIQKRGRKCALMRFVTLGILRSVPSKNISSSLILISFDLEEWEILIWLMWRLPKGRKMARRRWWWCH